MRAATCYPHCDLAHLLDYMVLTSVLPRFFPYTWILLPDTERHQGHHSKQERVLYGSAGATDPFAPTGKLWSLLKSQKQMACLK